MTESKFGFRSCYQLVKLYSRAILALQERDLRATIENRNKRESVIVERNSKWNSTGLGAALIMFLIYVNNVLEEISNYTSLYTDGAKIVEEIKANGSVKKYKILTVDIS